MRIGVDAMGGDHAPEQIVRGAVSGLELLNPDDRLVLVGRDEAIRAHLGDAAADPRIEIVDTPEVIEMDDSPVVAIRQKRNSSIAVIAKMAGDGQLDAVISAGNTGAFAAACQMKIKPLGPVIRPGIAVVVPSFAGPVTICDAGANVTPKPVHLLQYGQMATAYAEHILGIPNPRVGLISIGGEDVKGNPLIKKANELFREDASLNFVGNVEGRELFSGACEIGIADGFVGNVVLKLAEGVAEGIFKTLAREVRAECQDLAKRLDPIFAKIWEKHDYSEAGGAPLLGVNGYCIICHGSSDSRAIRNAIRAARDLVAKRMNEVIAERLSEVTADA